MLVSLVSQFSSDELVGTVFLTPSTESINNDS